MKIDIQISKDGQESVEMGRNPFTMLYCYDY